MYCDAVKVSFYVLRRCESLTIQSCSQSAPSVLALDLNCHIHIRV